jgi:hypothetical protein
MCHCSALELESMQILALSTQGCIFTMFVMSAFTLGRDRWQARLESIHACRTELVLFFNYFYYYLLCVPDRHVDVSHVCVGCWYL